MSSRDDLYKVSASDARNNLSDLLGQVRHGGKCIGLTRNGKLMAVLIPTALYEQFVDLCGPSNLHNPSGPATLDSSGDGLDHHHTGGAGLGD